ncbi:hypothetical protein BCR34DRAFT_590133 [Clohesyomyces aquaticus]|uniref:RING-type domain-containing protein n=1 Tax=Clohesyomyces aquaticus TaxID=1231657 RepID=A0A1Y1ZCD4_9PLEO|nr:hypothetical protein BCR34DRAFT_590133 [Clohesyomyces aquaticus]
MADSNYGTPLHYHYHLQNPPIPQTQGQESSAHPIYPPFAHYNSYLSYEAAGFNNFAPSHPSTQMSDPMQGHDAPFGYINQSRASHYQQFAHAAHAAHHSGGYMPPSAAGMYQSGPNQTPASGSFHSMQLQQGNQRPDLPETLPDLDMPHLMSHSSGGMYFPSLAYSHVSHVHPPPMPSFTPLQGRRPDQMLPMPSTPPTGRFDGDSVPPTPQSRGSIRGASDLLDQPRHLTSPNRRSSYERQGQHALQVPGGSERRAPHPFVTHSRRSDRSISPRVSNRRPFDRYAADLQHSNVPPEFGQAASRARRTRPRTIPPPRAHFIDASTPTSAQMQELRDKLRHFLPSELPDDASPTCDICQKDYSTKHVQPSEEEEVAIQLPCKHVFGEHCINTWFETCKTHKNKITCPMCRELLVKPMRLAASLGGLSPEALTFLRNTIDAGGFAGRGEHQLIAQLARVRELDGDFPHI